MAGLENEVKSVKQRFEIIGNSPKLVHALETAIKVAPTDINVLINGASGVGKESFSKIIHNLSARKHAPFIAVNCGAIPEGTIDSELFGHEKGSFTGAIDKRKGYFESANGGTIFLDEVGELPPSTQARLLRVLENGEFIKVGSSQVQKTDVRIIAATNRDLLERARESKFREDLYYRLATVAISVPKLSERKEDIYLLFRKFATDFAEQYKTNLIQLDEEAQQILAKYPWPGNIRQLKNITEQICVLEPARLIDKEMLMRHLPAVSSNLPVLFAKEAEGSNNMNERDIFYKVLFDLKKDVNDLKQVVFGMINNGSSSQERNYSSNSDVKAEQKQAELRLINEFDEEKNGREEEVHYHHDNKEKDRDRDRDEHVTIDSDDHVQYDENFSLEQQEINMIKKALLRHSGRRKKAAEDLGISERTLYRKIKQYELE
jgi:DNA-binding NtrC family response regulator